MLNAYAVLAGFLCLVQLGVGGGALFVGAKLWRDLSGSIPLERREDRLYLAVVLGTVQLVVSVVGWPLLYLLLQSYVPRWPGVMCIYGVLRIGSESPGAAGWLPGLLTTLQFTKALGVLLAGAWFEFYRLDRATTHSPLVRRVVGLLVLTSGLAVFDATVELAYLAIPKQDESLSVGCCTAPAESARWSQRLPATIWSDATSRHGLVLAAVAANGLFVGGLAMTARNGRRRRLVTVGLTTLGAALSLPANLLILTHWLAPTLLRLPYHACPYDLVSRAPESLPALAAIAFGYLAALWAVALQWLGREASAETYQRAAVHRLARRALLGLFVGMTFLAAELALADLRSSNGCHYDGQPIDAHRQVRVEFEDGSMRRFCSLACAEAWLAAAQLSESPLQRKEPSQSIRSIWVTDERTGVELRAEAGYYVRSRVISHPWTRDRRHVFARESDAKQHAESFQGRVLEGAQRSSLIFRSRAK